MTKQLLLGDEAVALGAIDAGIAAAFSYAGTPSTEIFEAVQAAGPQVVAQWSSNEKVAYEEALGVSYIGKRALVSMKHVGLNVAADPLMGSAATGVNGGMVIAVVDDPGMHSSQNEQDSRFYAEFAKISCFEPSTQQECYDMTREAFRLSEFMGLPCMIRLVTRIAHSRASVTLSPDDESSCRDRALPLPDPNDWTLVPANARKRFKRLLGLQDDLLQTSEVSLFNILKMGGPRGIICTGPGYNYVRELLGPNPKDTILRIGMYPLPSGLVRRLADHCDEVVIIEEGYPLIEQKLRGLFSLPKKAIKGKMNGALPPDGELLPHLVAKALGIEVTQTYFDDPIAVNRPPQFCKGCPHCSSFGAIVEAVKDFERPLMFGDIGCYAMALMPPYRAVDSCVEMGSSIGMAHGASKTGAHPVLCTIGDSTFTHSGMASLLDAVHYDANITVLLLDNAAVGMTGQQESMATGEKLVEIVRGMGVNDVHLIDPLPKNHAINVEAIKEAVAHHGLSVVIARRPCIRIKPARLAELSKAQVPSK